MMSRQSQCRTKKALRRFTRIDLITVHSTIR